MQVVPRHAVVSRGQPRMIHVSYTYDAYHTYRRVSRSTADCWDKHLSVGACRAPASTQCGALVHAESYGCSAARMHAAHKRAGLAMSDPVTCATSQGRGAYQSRF